MTTGQQARRAVAWNTGFSLFRDVFQFALSVTLARLVAPESFGQATLVTGTIGFFIVFSFRAFLSHTLQNISEREADYQIHFTAGAVIQVGLFALANLAAWIAGRIPAYAPVEPLVHLASFVFLLDLPSEIRVKQLERTMDWRRLRLLHAIGILGSGLTAVTLASVGAEAYALVGPSMFVQIPFIVDLFVVQRWRPDWSWSWKRYRKAWHFGIMRLLSGTAVAGRQLLEGAMLARLTGFLALGLYGRAMGLAQILCLKFVVVFLQAVYPVLTRRVNGGTRIGPGNALVFRGAAWMVVPVAVLASVLAGPLIIGLYGAKWTSAVPLVPYTMSVAALAALLHTIYTLLLANNLARVCLWSDLSLLAAAILALGFVLPHGIAAYLTAIAIAQSILLVVLCVPLLRQRLFSVAELGFALAPALIATALAYVGSGLAVAATGIVPGVAAGVALRALTFAATYLLVLRTLFPVSLHDLVKRLPMERHLSRAFLFNR